MIRLPQRSTRTYTLFPYTTLFRSLARRAGGLELQAPHHPGFKPIRCDWTDAEMSRRVAAGQQQLLARAIGLHKYKDLSVLDAPAGLGRDGFVLAPTRPQITTVERQTPFAARLSAPHVRPLPPAT